MREGRVCSDYWNGCYNLPNLFPMAWQAARWAFKSLTSCLDILTQQQKECNLFITLW